MGSAPYARRRLAFEAEWIRRARVAAVQCATLGVKDSHGLGSERCGGGNQDDLADGHYVAAENTAADQRGVVVGWDLYRPTRTFLWRLRAGVLEFRCQHPPRCE